MATSASSSAGPDRKRRIPVNAFDLWMLFSTILLAIAYLTIRTRIANYVYVAKWMRSLLAIVAGI